MVYDWWWDIFIRAEEGTGELSRSDCERERGLCVCVCGCAHWCVHCLCLSLNLTVNTPLVFLALCGPIRLDHDGVSRCQTAVIRVIVFRIQFNFLSLQQQMSQHTLSQATLQCYRIETFQY